MTHTVAIGYIAAWGTALCIALAMLVRGRASYALLSRAYVRFLAVPWKLATFSAATIFFVVVAPLTGDPTWDRFDGFFMAALTYATAPWSVGTLYLAARGRIPRARAYVAACLWLFSASWSYDLYLFVLHGQYPGTFAANIVASSVLYASGGLFWNLVHHEGRGVIFAFMTDGWPSPPRTSQRRIAGYAAVLVAIVVGMMAPFAYHAYQAMRSG